MVSTIDINGTGNPGYNWYVTKPFGFATTPASDISVSGGVLTLNGTGAQNWAISTLAPANNAQGYVGQVFAGGFYVEARIAFDNTLVNTANGWPSFWGESLQHMIDASHPSLEQWPGQPTGYTHFIEDDFFEYDTAPFAGANSFGGAMHDWYGIYNQTCSGFCNVSNPNFAVNTGSTRGRTSTPSASCTFPALPRTAIKGR